jgi:glutamine synthetase
VSAPTIEFRLPDGSAHPHLLLAGVAQAMLAGRSTADLEGLLARTSSTRKAQAGGPVTLGDQLPGSFAEIADLLAAQRSVFEAGGVFPSTLIDQFLTILRS